MQRRGCTVLDASYMSCVIKRGKGNAKTGTEVWQRRSGARQELLGWGRTRRQRAEKRGRFLGEVSRHDRPVVCSSLSRIFDIPHVSSNTVLRRSATRNKQRHRPPTSNEALSHTPRVRGTKFYLILSSAGDTVSATVKIDQRRHWRSLHIAAKPIRKLSDH